MTRLILLGALLVSAAACQSEPVETNGPAPAPAAQPAAEGKQNVSAISGLPLVPLEIRSGGKTHRFTVEVAATADEQAYGLMNRTRLGPNEGMVFPFRPARPASFWMKNTLIPLDMIFVRTDGSIARIATATPHSLEPVAVSEPVAAVLEIPGGRSAELGIAAADARVSWPGGPAAR